MYLNVTVVMVGLKDIIVLSVLRMFTAIAARGRCIPLVFTSHLSCLSRFALYADDTQMIIKGEKERRLNLGTGYNY